ncbi:hypothetical protein NPIL_578651 [Nephila pilipes]|uniref:Uncharacterized protein n=1 Tax=Nephila pilipes TaxID=299642 RepID=A0A8X6PUL9_NEPPI|nr:hypothetical protein NPIL_190391 [Nephila pilipes]GFT86639.1 hypothetical protein NPIL_578651 [Nephila pilipes]
MLGQLYKLFEALPRYEYSSKDQQSNIHQQVSELRDSARYQVQYFASKDYEAKLCELNEVRKVWDPQAQMPLDDGFQLVRRCKQPSPRKNSGDNTSKKLKKKGGHRNVESIRQFNHRRSTRLFGRARESSDRCNTCYR